MQEYVTFLTVDKSSEGITKGTEEVNLLEIEGTINRSKKITLLLLIFQTKTLSLIVKMKIETSMMKR
jgi:hypothetical protein